MSGLPIAWHKCDYAWMWETSGSQWKPCHAHAMPLPVTIGWTVNFVRLATTAEFVPYSDVSDRYTRVFRFLNEDLSPATPASAPYTFNTTGGQEHRMYVEFQTTEDTLVPSGFTNIPSAWVRSALLTWTNPDEAS